MRYPEIGDTVYIATGSTELQEGTIVHVFTLDYGPTKYVIERQTHIDPIYDVRDWYTISFTKKGPLNIWKGIK